MGIGNSEVVIAFHDFPIPHPHSPLPVFKLPAFSSRIPDYFHNTYRTIRRET